MKRLLLTSILAVAPMFAGSNCFTDGRCAHVQQSTTTARKVWIASIAAAFAGQTLDCVSSIGGHELNGMIGNGSNGQFNVAKGFSLKLGMVAGGATLQYVLAKHGMAHYKLWTVANGVMAGIGFQAAGTNWGRK